MIAAGKDNRHAPVLRTVPPALALRPDYPMHYALLPTSGPNHKTEIWFQTIGISASKSPRMLTKSQRHRGIRKQPATLTLTFILTRPISLSQNVAVSQRKIEPRLLFGSGRSLSPLPVIATRSPHCPTCFGAGQGGRGADRKQSPVLPIHPMGVFQP
jgi:hypothetical protein